MQKIYTNQNGQISIENFNLQIYSDQITAITGRFNPGNLKIELIFHG